MTNISEESVEVTEVSSKVELDTAVEIFAGNKPTEVPFIDNNYVLAGEGSANIALGSDIPGWLNEAITSRIGDGTSSFKDVLDDLYNFTRNLEEGVNSQIAKVRTDTKALDQKLDAQVTRLDGNSSAYLTASSTEVTDKLAKGSFLEVLSANFNTAATEAGSVFVDQQNAYADDKVTTANKLDGMSSAFTDLNTEVSANATIVNEGYTTAGLDPVTGKLVAGAGEFSRLRASVGDMSVSLLTAKGVATGTFKEWDGNSRPEVGMIHKCDGTDCTNGKVFMYFGGSWSEGYNPQYVDGDGISYELGWAEFKGSIVDQLHDAQVKHNALQSQVDGSITTWFDYGAPEFALEDADFTNTNASANVISGVSKVFIEASVQMFLYEGADATLDLTTANFTDTAVWKPIYKINKQEQAWYEKDGLDVSNGYFWYVSDGSGGWLMRPLAVSGVEVTPVELGNRIGDLYYDKLTGYGYRFAHEDILDTPDKGAVFSWIRITDVDITKALADAAKAQDTADGKRRVFGVTPYVPYDENDLWDKTFTDGSHQLLRAVIARGPNGTIDIDNDWTQVATDDNSIHEFANEVGGATDGATFMTGTEAGKDSTVEGSGGAKRADGTSHRNGDIWICNNAMYPSPYDGSYVKYKWTGKTASTAGSWEKLTAQAATAYAGWAGGDSSLVRDANGHVTGWSYKDGSGTDSDFVINAGKFRVAGTGGVSAADIFTVDTNNGAVKFNGVVTFSSISDAKTEITDKINNAQSTANTANSANNVALKTGNYTNSVLAADLADPTSTTTIDGGNITTGVINSVATTSTGTARMQIDLNNGWIYIQ